MLKLRKRADKTGGEESRAADGSWPLAGVELVDDAPADHAFADTFVARAIRDGYLTFDEQTVATTDVDGVPYDRDPVVTGSTIVLHLTTGELRYRVLEHPGRYRDPDGSVRVSHEYRCKLERKGK